MKAKTIKSILRKKVNDWIESIDDAALREAVKDKIIVTGGSIASMLLNEKVNDIDIYFRDHATTLAVANHYVNKFQLNPPPKFKKTGGALDISVHESPSRVKIVVKSAGIAGEDDADGPGYQFFETVPDPDAGDAEEYVAAAMETAKEAESKDKPKFRPVFLSANAITLFHGVQIVIRFFGEPDQIHENYDFAHCTNYWTSWDNSLLLRPAALEALLARELRYVGSKYPLCSIFRLRKFIQRGWTVNAGQIVKMAFQLNALDLNRIDVLEDQLTGVDTAYFLEVVNLLRAKDPERVDAAYLMQIIDKMF